MAVDNFHSPEFAQPIAQVPRRERRIARFKQAQRQKREWLNFVEIAEDWTKQDGAPTFEVALCELAKDLLAGWFEVKGRAHWGILSTSIRISRNRQKPCVVLAVNTPYEHVQEA